MYYSNNYGKNLLFNSQPFHEYQTGVFERLKGDIERLSADDLKSEEKRKSIISSATRTVPTVDWTKTEIIKKEEKTLQSYDHFHGAEKYKATVCTFGAPFIGDQIMFDIRPTRRRLSQEEVYVNGDDTLSFELIASESGEQNKADLKRVQDNIDFNLDCLRSDIAEYNSSLESTILNLFKQRAAELDKHSSQVDSFGIPVRGME